jgi:hypothetical protein
VKYFCTSEVKRLFLGPALEFCRRKEKARIPENFPRASEPARDVCATPGKQVFWPHIFEMRAQIAEDFRRNSFARGKPEFTSTVFNWPLTAHVPDGFLAGPSPSACRGERREPWRNRWQRTVNRITVYEPRVLARELHLCLRRVWYPLGIKNGCYYRCPL